MCFAPNLAFTFPSSLPLIIDLITGTWLGAIIPLECKHVRFLSLVVSDCLQIAMPTHDSWGSETTPRWQTKRKGISVFASKVGSGFRNPFSLFLRDCPATFACRKEQRPCLTLCCRCPGGTEGHRNFYLCNPRPWKTAFQQSLSIGCI